MNASSTLGTAFLRAAWIFLAAFAGAAIPDYSTLRFAQDWTIGASAEHAVLIGLAAAFAAAAVRGGWEGLVDRDRQIAGEVKSSDVQAGSAGKA